MGLISYLFGLLMLALSGVAWPEEMRGFMVFGHEARTLQICGDQRIFWIHATKPLNEEIQAQYQALVNDPYEPVYVEVDGEIVDQPVGGFAADYAATIRINELRSISKNKTEACRSYQPEDAGKPTPNAESKTYVFICDSQATYTVRTTEKEAWIFRPEGTFQLTAAPVEQGVKYTDGVFELYIDGEQARLGDTGSELLLCQNDRRRAIWERAKLDGADFRAVGNEPGWHLEIQAGRRMVLVTDYGASRVERPLPEPTVDSANSTTRWDAGELILEVIGRPCRDTMSDESFESSVVVIWGEQTLQGCGRALH